MHKPALGALFVMLLSACTMALAPTAPGGSAGAPEDDSGPDPHATPGPSGTLDASFGKGGIVTTDVATGSNDLALSVALQPDGKLVAAGASVEFVFKDVQGTFALVRYLADGTPDPGFGTQGRVIVGKGSSAQARGVALAGDGGIVTAGWSLGVVTDVLVSRHLTSGKLDAGFGDGGLASGGMGEGYTRGIAMQPDGKILVVGYGGSYVDYDAWVMRLEADGKRDASFGSAGLKKVDWGTWDDQAQAIAWRDGKIYLAGSAKPHGFALSRLDAEGAPDPTFGNSGHVLVSSEDEAKGLAIDAEGRVLLAGGQRVLRFLPDGTLDSSFGSAGTVLLAGQELHAVGIQPDGKILLAGSQDGAASLTRLQADGTPDTGFASQGRAKVAASDGAAVGHALLVQPDGRIVVAGKAFKNKDKSGHDDFMLLRFWP